MGGHGQAKPQGRALPMAQLVEEQDVASLPSHEQHLPGSGVHRPGLCQGGRGSFPRPPGTSGCHPRPWGPRGIRRPRRMRPDAGSRARSSKATSRVRGGASGEGGPDGIGQTGLPPGIQERHLVAVGLVPHGLHPLEDFRAQPLLPLEIAAEAVLPEGEFLDPFGIHVEIQAPVGDLPGLEIGEGQEFVPGGLPGGGNLGPLVVGPSGTQGQGDQEEDRQGAPGDGTVLRSILAGPEQRHGPQVPSEAEDQGQAEADGGQGRRQGKGGPRPGAGGRPLPGCRGRGGPDPGRPGRGGWLPACGSACAGFGARARAPAQATWARRDGAGPARRPEPARSRRPRNPRRAPDRERPRKRPEHRRQRTRNSQAAPSRGERGGSSRPKAARAGRPRTRPPRAATIALAARIARIPTVR